MNATAEPAVRSLHIRLGLVLLAEALLARDEVLAYTAGQRGLDNRAPGGHALCRWRGP